MPKRKTLDPTAKSTRPAVRASEPHISEQPAAGWIPSVAAIRETVESVVIAFVLAFLFRTFEAEAFVIPTGSMAPTLMGRHKDLICPKCGHEYQVSASDQPDGNGGSSELYVFGATCPMCRYTAPIGRNDPDGEKKSYSGDRILVAKFPYQFHDPKRWDVIVFKFPSNSTMNFIKRLVGLPGETIKIHRGHVWIHKLGDPPDKFEIARKPPDKILATLQLVYDNGLAPTMDRLHWPARWTPPGGAGPGSWTSDGTALAVDGSAAGESWVRYEHRVPTFDQWQEMETRGALRPGDEVRQQLISDFTAYNTGQTSQQGRVPDVLEKPDPNSLGAHWVGDLAIQGTLHVQSPTGEVILELVRGGRRFQCRLDVATGTATLTHDGPDAANFHPAAATAIRGVGKHAVVFSNVAEELRLWVDGRVVAFDGPTTYDATALGTQIPQRADLAPAGIASHHAAIKVEHLKLSRDIYYTAVDAVFHSPFTDYLQFQPALDDPTTWEEAFAEPNMRTVQFPLAAPKPNHPEKDQFFVLGDNSAQSRDGRLWRSDENFVERELLIGKALFIYWPHSWDEVTSWHIPFPFFPNVGRMHFIR